MTPSTDQGPDLKRKQFSNGRGPKRQKVQREKPAKDGSSEEVLIADVRALFAAQKISNASQAPIENGDTDSANIEIGAEQQKPTSAEGGALVVADATSEVPLPERFSEIEVKVVEISSTGDGLALHPPTNRIYVVPFSVPGDIVRAKVITHFSRENYSLADFVSVVEPSPLRDESRVNCKYFSKCSGCQFQMLDYSTQLQHKKSIVEKAYKNFSHLPSELIPAIQDTIGSPLQYGYRTKLTPHFDGPPGYRSRSNRRNDTKAAFENVPEIGFMQKGKRQTLDIEDCPIGTDTVRMGMKLERTRVADELHKYKRGATILLRESTKRIYKNDPEYQDMEIPPNTIKVATSEHTDVKTCITDMKGESTEYIDQFLFTSIAGSFFQNNNSILPIFTQYIRDHILPPPGSFSPDLPEIQYLIDAYSGSGLFTITLSSLFKSSTGIDISDASIISARRNAELNKLDASRCSFMAADAPTLFQSVTYPKDETVVVIDPPRKGCDESFLSQLLKFGPRRVVYVSCNVHTQARDVGVLVKGSENGTRYVIESLRGFDFFPQTGHVEGVAVLSRVDGGGEGRKDGEKDEEVKGGDEEMVEFKEEHVEEEQVKEEHIAVQVKEEQVNEEAHEKKIEE
ncbi:putative tRNA (uracil-5-)-methyltransferase [Sclerotinia borealis F-4128]|uniref:tRNA (uracil(54)-C(5))-methyltransferase n=1 Tax=Sclerotinia borealis (strain F-4128) TaxID=1432307 RepID=W9C5C5_SCLBF|nr:putative tRNA (uracil-5-)-methyltransferase [Sclerotinia borealis F-4128]